MGEHVVSLRPRYGEVDSMGVVYHAHYLQYFDVGRTEWMRAAGMPYADLEQRGLRLAVVDVRVRYLRGARYDRLLQLHTRVAEVGGATVTFTYELRDGGTLLATGLTRLGCVDRNNRPVRLPADARATLDRGRDDAPPASEGA
ncbi:MAG: acyl-CoA thioesterase [Planctomycetes bacterium]|nr:acyl-CoA thioesterase [Planctomycetota bacterium]